MFKLKRIISSGVNVPEPELLTLMPNTYSEAGSVLTMSEDGLLTVGSATTKPTHVLIATANKGDERALCYRISPNMIFETSLYGDPEYLYEGAIVTLYNNKNGFMLVTDNTEGGVATVYDMMGAKKTGDSLLVVFN